MAEVEVVSERTAGHKGWLELLEAAMRVGALGAAEEGLGVAVPDPVARAVVAELGRELEDVGEGKVGNERLGARAEVDGAVE